jgi:hypothetical protein
MGILDTLLTLWLAIFVVAVVLKVLGVFFEDICNDLTKLFRKVRNLSHNPSLKPRKSWG